MIPAEFKTPPEIAQQVGCSESFLAKLRVKGEGPPYYKIGARVYYSEVDIESWLRRNRIEPGAQ